jgi:trimeric autotransporter adhesin
LPAKLRTIRPSPRFHSPGAGTLLAAALTVLAASAPAQTITTVAGGGPSNGTATQKCIGWPYQVALDSSGNRYLATGPLNMVVRISSAGVLTIVAGNAASDSNGDGGPATSASVFNPSGVAVDGAGNVYIADTNAHRIRRVDTGGSISTIAGTGASGYFGDGGPASSAMLNGPRHLAFSAGFLYIADTGNHRIRRIEIATGIITLVAGNGVPGFANGPAASAQFNTPNGVAVTTFGDVYVADTSNQRVRRISGGNVTTVAGTGVAGYNGEGSPATNFQLSNPEGVALDGSSNVYIADENNSRIRRLTGTTISTVAGGTSGFGGDTGPPLGAAMNRPYSMVVDVAGNIHIADTFNSRLRVVSGGIIDSVAGNGTVAFSGDGGLAVQANLFEQKHVTLDPSGHLVVADERNARVRRVDTTTGVITTVAGTGQLLPFNDGVPALTANLRQPYSAAMDGAGNLYIADTFNHRVRKVDTGGTLTTIAGTGTPGYNGDGSPATSFHLNSPKSVVVDSAGNVYVADESNHRIRRITPGGAIGTFAGTGVPGFNGDGPAASRQLLNPNSVAVDADDNVFIGGGNRIRKVDTVGNMTTVAGDGLSGFMGDGGLATAARLSQPKGVAVDAVGNILIADTGNHRVRLVEKRTGRITTVAGGAVAGFLGDGGPATAARLNQPFSVAVSAAGRVYVSDSLNNRVRAMTLGTDLQVTKTDGQTTDVPGTTVAYTIRVTNNGPNLVTSVNLVDTPPLTLTIQSYVPLVGAYSSGTGDWTGLSLATGQFAEMTVNALISSSATGNVVNLATVAPPLGLTDPVPGNDQGADSTFMTPEADVSILKTDSPDPATVGMPLTYTLNVFNNGPSDATNVTVTDNLPAGVTFVSATPPCSFSGSVTCVLGTIAAGSGHPPLTITLVPTQPGTLVNTASVSHGEFDPDSTNDSSTVTTAVTGGPADTVRYLTVTSKDGQNVVQWLNPTGFGNVRIRYKTGPTACTFPTNPDGSDGSTGPFDFPAGTPNEPGRFEHNGLTNGDHYCYTAWVDTGAPWSAGRFVKGRPFAVPAGPGAKWGFNMGIFSMVAPGNGGGVVYSVANDGALHAMVKGSGGQGGTWPGPLASLPVWKPQSMNGPSQGRASGISVPTAGSTRTIFLSSQDGHVYAFNADTGAPAWSPSSPLLAPSPHLQAHPAGVFTMFGGTRDLILVGTRDPAGSKFYALRVLDGSTLAPGWEFDGGAFGRIGAINGQATVDYAARRVYFGSREFDAVDNKTVWCLDVETGVPCAGFTPQAYGNVDTGVSLSGGRLFVGTNDGAGTDPRVRALRASDGLEDWSYPIAPVAEGAPKGYVTVDRFTGDVYFSTATTVWALDTGGGVKWTCNSLTSPSIPVYAPGGAFVYVGAGDGTLHRLHWSGGSEDTTAPFPITLGDGSAAVGSPTYDLPAGYMYVGAEDGIVYAVQLP